MTVVNMFPATVQTPNGKFLKTRVQVKDDHVRVFEVKNGAIALVADAEVREYKPSNNRFKPTELVTADGETWVLRKASGCGCGSALRSFDPETWVSA